jgi:stress response protein YsnF
LTACSSTKQEEVSYSSYSEPSTTSYTVQESSGAQSYRSSTGEDIAIPLHEEQLSVGKQSVNSQVTIRKIVTTETVSQPIELRKERVVIEREGSAQNSSSASATSQPAAASSTASTEAKPAAQDEASGAKAESTETAQKSTVSEPAGAATSSSGSGNAFEEQTYTIQLREEQPVIQKNVVQTGRVVARKNSESQRQTVQQQVRKESVQVDKGNSQNVEIRDVSTVTEPAGAEPVIEIETAPKKTYLDDPNTLDEINKGNNTRGGAEDLQDFDEKANVPK